MEFDFKINSASKLRHVLINITCSLSHCCPMGVSFHAYSLVPYQSRVATIKHNLDFPLISAITSMLFFERMVGHVSPSGFQFFLRASLM